MSEGFLQGERLDIEAVFAAWSDRTALVAPGVNLDFAGLRDELARVIAVLEGLGAGPGGMVAVHLKNSPLNLYLLLAAWVMGFTLVNLDPKAPAGRVPAGIRPDFVVSRETGADWGAAQVIAPEAFAAARPEPAPLAPIPLDREATVVFTSGSTGPPKGVVHTLRNLYYSALGTNEFLKLRPGDRWLVSLPLFHVGGLLIFVRTFLAGAAAMMHDEPGRLTEALTAFRPSVISVVPTQLARLLESPETARRLAACRAVLLGGGPCPRHLVDKALDMGVPVLPTYGSTEACAMVTAVSPKAPRQDFHTAGKALPYRQIAVDQEGVILIGGRTLFSRYIAEGREIERARGGKFATSDLGTLDPAGNLTVLGRRDQVFISGGENINPNEIENALAETGLVEEAVVVPAPHREFGRVAWACVKVKGGLDEDAMKAALKKILPPYKIPKKFLPFPEGGPGEGMKRSRKELEILAAMLQGKK